MSKFFKVMIDFFKHLWIAVMQLVAIAADRETPGAREERKTVEKALSARQRMRGHNKLYRKLVRRTLWAIMHPRCRSRWAPSAKVRAWQRSRATAIGNLTNQYETRFAQLMAAGVAAGITKAGDELRTAAYGLRLSLRLQRSAYGVAF